LWFGGGKRAAQFAGGQRAEQAALLLVVAGGEDGAERHPLHDQQVGGVVADAAQFLHGQGGRQHAAGATVLLRKRDREQADFAQQVEHVLRILGAAVDGGGARRHLVARQPPHQRLDLALFVVQRIGLHELRALQPAALSRHLIMRIGV
jgi:hypothetical protein